MVSQPVPALGLPSWYILQEVLSRVDADPTSAAVVVRAHDERIKDPRRAAVAIKCIPRSCVARGAKYIEREVLHHRRLWHRHVVMFRELLLTDSHLCIVMDYIGGGTLHQLVLEKRRLSEGLARWFFQQLILAVDYCHQKGVMNRDVKLENIVVDDRQKHHPVVYVCDFGLSKHVNNSDPTTLLGTGKYMAPEVIYQGAKGLRYDGKKADIYSCGVCLAVMLFGYYPEVLVGGQPVTSDNDARQTGMRVKALVGAGEACLQVVLPQQRDADGRSVEPLSESCLDLLKGLLDPCADTRMNMDAIWNHPWFRAELPEGAREYNSHLASAPEVHSNTQSPEDLRKIVELAKSGR